MTIQDLINKLQELPEEAKTKDVLFVHEMILYDQDDIEDYEGSDECFTEIESIGEEINAHNTVIRLALP